MVFKKRNVNHEFKSETNENTEHIKGYEVTTMDSNETLITPCCSNQPESNNNMTQDLMTLLMQAIDLWAEKYNLLNLPKDIVFEQALSAMLEIDRINKQRKK